MVVFENIIQRSKELNLAGRDLKLQTGGFAYQADGAVLVSLGDTVVLATCKMSKKPREGTDFFPLMVDYEERFYAAGKIKGSRFVKREGRPSDNAVLRARLIDRPIRPLFPKGAVNDVQVIVTVLSADLEVDPGAIGIIAASASLMLSGMPFAGPVASVRIGLVTDENGNEQLVVNPTYLQCEKGKLDLVVAGTSDAITMVEAAAKEVPEEKMLEALDLAHRHIKKLCQLQEEFIEGIRAKPKQMIVSEATEEAREAVKNFLTQEKLDSIKGVTKHEVNGAIEDLALELLGKHAQDIEAEKLKESDLKNILSEAIEKNMRKSILKSGKRIDGRKPDEIRPLASHVGLLPRTHGSALFQRGETQALSLTTLGAPGKAQIIDTMDEDTIKRYMHFYNFPPFSVGDVKPLRGPSRREIGHGNLAERALEAVLPEKEVFPYTIMVVSEILSCNGSSSMAAVCGSTLSLMDAGVPITHPVAGIAMGLITDLDKPVLKGGPYKILTDIQGLEDFAGDMDFKVAGSEAGITALQMDIKVKGITVDIMREALAQAKKARLQVLDTMFKTLPKPREQLSQYAPLIVAIPVMLEQIRDVIGPRGETIQKITGETGCEIDIEQDDKKGMVMITAPNREKGEIAKKWVEQIIYIPKAGDEFDGKVTRLMDFGAFVEFAPGKEGLVHISQLDHRRVNRVEDVCKVGDKMKVKLMEIDDMGRYNLSRKACLPVPPGGVEREERFDAPRGGGMRGGGGGGGFRKPFRR